jgi:hypothetical protein
MPPARIAGAWVLSGLVLCPVAGGAGSSLPGNPYHQICERNVFGLKAPQPAHLEPPSAPLPKITLTGITTILGSKRALLKVQFPPKPPQPAKEQSYILTEGQRDGSIEVLEINEKTANVKVDNSGTVMEITFEKSNPTPPASTPRPQPYWPRLPMQAGVRLGGAIQLNRR